MYFGSAGECSRIPKTLLQNLSVFAAEKCGPCLSTCFRFTIENPRDM